MLKRDLRCKSNGAERIHTQICAPTLLLDWKQRIPVAFAGLLLLSSVAVYGQTPGNILASPAVAAPASADQETVRQLLTVRPPQLVIGTGDSIRVQVFEIEKYDYTPRVDPDGRIAVPLVDSVQVAGLNASGAEKLIADRLEALGMVKDPHVHITLVDQPSQTVTVSGEVEKPGVFAALTARTLIGGIAMAGGLKNTASREITLLRPATGQTFVVNLGDDPKTSAAADIPLIKGDTIIVRVVGVVYVLGAVKNSGMYRLKTSSATTVRQAIAMAGGSGWEGRLGKTVIIRDDDGQHTEIPFSLNTDASKPLNDMTLRSDDIVYVPTGAAKAAVKGGGVSIAAIIAAAAIYRN